MANSIVEPPSIFSLPFRLFACTFAGSNLLNFLCFIARYTAPVAARDTYFFFIFHRNPGAFVGDCSHWQRDQILHCFFFLSFPIIPPSPRLFFFGFVAPANWESRGSMMSGDNARRRWNNGIPRGLSLGNRILDLSISRDYPVSVVSDSDSDWFFDFSMHFHVPLYFSNSSIPI